MPLAFQSINKGVIPFGFFNIETDLLIMDQYFVFAYDFCQNILDMSEKEGQASQIVTWKIYHIEDRSDIGDFKAREEGRRLMANAAP